MAGPADERTVRACGEAGVPTLRTMAAIGAGESYTQAEERLWREYDALLPALERSGVTLGVQNHCDRFVANALGLFTGEWNEAPPSSKRQLAAGVGILLLAIAALGYANHLRTI